MCEHVDVYKQMAKLAERWMRRCGLTLRMRSRFRMVDAAVGGSDITPEQRGLFAAACDLYDTLCTSPLKGERHCVISALSQSRRMEKVDDMAGFSFKNCGDRYV